MTDQYHWWRNALAGNAGPVHSEEPQSGFYKLRDKRRGLFEPVAIWRDHEDNIICRVGDSVKDPVLTWQWCAGAPVSKADAKHAFEHGSWPGDVPTIGDNSGDLSLMEQLRDYMETARSWLQSTEVTNKLTCDQAGNYAAELTKLKGRLDKERDSKVRPHLDAQRDINAEYKPTIDEADKLSKDIKRAATAFMQAEKRRLEEEQRRKYEAERKAAEEARKAAAAAATPVEDVPEPPPPPQPVKVNAGGQRGRRMGLRTFTEYVVEDYAAALAFAKDSDEVRSAVEKVCKAAAKAGQNVPGVTVIKEERAA